MKKFTMMIAVAALAAGSVFAGEGEYGPKGPQGKRWNEDRDERPGGPMSAEMKDQMRAEHRAIRELGKAARSETDEAKQAELVAQLRVKLGEVADRMQAHQEERLAQAEERLAGLKERIADGKANRDARIEEQVQRILSGERPQRPERFKDFPNAKGGLRGGRGGPEFGPDGEMPPPPMGNDDDLPPPPPEE